MVSLFYVCTYPMLALRYRYLREVVLSCREFSAQLKNWFICLSGIEGIEGKGIQTLKNFRPKVITRLFYEIVLVRTKT